MKHYRPDIDGLRAVAIIPVVLFHLGIAGFGGGYVGVDVFFVISGYLITSIILPEVRAGAFSFAHFYERRVRRLFPALFVVLTVTSALAAVLLIPSDLRAYGASLVATLFFGANLFFWRTAGYFDAPAEMKPLLHNWSLSVEEQFYIVFPTVLLLLHRWLPQRMRASITAIAVVSFAAAVWALEDAPGSVFYLTTYRAWELMLGVLLALGAVPELRGQALRETLSLIGLVMIVYAVVAFSAVTPFPAANALYPTVGTALIILAGSGGSTYVTRALSVQPLVYIGLISYPLYLWHWPLIVLLKYYVLRDTTLIERFAVIVVSVALAALTYRYVERPFRAKDVWSRRRLFGASAAYAAVLLLVGFGAFLGDGWPGRLDPAERRIDAVSYEGFSPSECYRGPRDPERDDTGCPIGAPGAPSFLVWGDSHAMALLDALDSTAAAMGVSGKFVAMAGCPPLLGVTRYDHEGRDCAGFNANVVELVEATESIREVILIARWGLSANGTRLEAEGGRPAIISPQGITGNPTAFRAGLERTLDFLTDRNLEVTFVTQAPGIGWDVPSTLVRASRFGRETLAVPTLDEHRRRQRVVDEALVNLSTRYSFDVLDVTSLFCGEGTCAIIRNGRPLYRDGHHLSAFGASTLAPSIETILGS